MAEKHPIPAFPANTDDPWDVCLVRQQPPGSLVAVAREGRLTRETRLGSVRVGLTLVDEAVLALVDLATQRRRNVTFVYPAPAGEVSVLLAAQVLLRKFLQKAPSQSVGILTADSTIATRTWHELGIATVGSCSQISEVFPCYRAEPNGDSPLGRRPFRGVLIGGRFAHWPVDFVVVDHLSGPVDAAPTVPTVHLFADPLDPSLERLFQRGELIWGWSEGDLSLLRRVNRGVPSTIPFSVSAERLDAIAAGVKTRIHVAHHTAAEKLVRRLRDDLRTLRDLAGASAPPAVLKGIRVAWHHVFTLTSLPCRPSEFDRFAGVPPIAARAVRTFAPEIAAWARTLGGDLGEVAEVVASDLEDLRAALEDTDAFSGLLSQIASEPGETLVVVRTHTAARAFLHSLNNREGSDRAPSVRAVAVRGLHREGTCKRAVVAGAPARWDWHRFDSGLTTDLHVLVLGESDGHLGRRALAALRQARARWASVEIKGRAWRELVGGEPPPAPVLEEPVVDVSIVDAPGIDSAKDPFELFEPLLHSAPFIVGEEGVEETIAEEATDGEWRAAVDAVEIVTDAGVIRLPRDRVVDVRKGDEIFGRRAEALEAGTYLLVDRRAGRLGLLEAVADRLKRQRPDLLVANLLISDLRSMVQETFEKSKMTRVELFERMRLLGFEKSYFAARSYVDEEGPLAPRDLEDLQRLNRALELGLSDRRVQEIFAGLRRWRTFRRAVGKALVAAARGSAASADSARIDHETGLSTADLHELVLEAVVLEVRSCPEPVPVTEIGRLERR